MIHVKAAIKIQSWYRSVQQRLHFRKLKSCCLVLQRRVRASQERNKFHNGGGCCENQKVSANECIEEKLCTNISEDLKSGTPVLETKQRRYGVFLVHEVAAALQIQSHWRGHCQRHVFAKQRAAIVLIQAYYRAYKQSKTYKKLRSGIMKVQVLYRHKLAKAKLEAQAQIDDKCQIEIMHHQKLLSEGQKVQALWRSYKARKSYLKQKSAAKKIQQQWRSYLVHRYKIFAAVKIQAHVRRYFAQNVFLKQMTAVICIQKYYRAYIQRITYRKYREKITKIQGFLRSRSIRRKYQERRQASMKIQSAFRLWRESQHVSKAAEVNQLIHTSAQRIQAAWRRFLHNRMEKKSNAAVVVQAAYKAWKTRKEFRFQIKKIIYLQAYYRGNRIRRKIIKKRSQHTLPNPMPNALTLEKEEQLQPRSFTSNDGDPAPDQSIAASCRYGLDDCSSDTELDTEEKLSPSDGEASSILINGVGIPAMAAVRIQACWRDYRSRGEISSSERVCDKLGNIHSSHGWDSSGKVFNFYEQQAWWILSKWSGTFRQRLWFLRAKRSAVKIQKWWISVAERRSRAAHIIQRHFQAWKLRKYFKQAKLSTIIIQAHWRGHLTRKHMDHASRQLMDLRRRMQYTAATMDSNMSLGNRLKVALAALLDHKTVSGILKTCATIDMATQHSIYCCEKLAEGGAITKLLQLIQTTNRSPPHEQVLKHALSILGNLARCPDLAARILKTPGFLEIVAEQLQMCRNKEEIFFKAMRVLQLVCANSECPDVVRKRPLILRRLQHLADLLDQKVAAERRNFEKLSETVGFQTRKLAEKKVEEAITQSQSVIMLLKTVTNHNVNEYNKHTQNRRGGGPFPVHASKRSSIGVLSLPRRPPLQNCSNKKVF
ncbi:hypothetical protein O6H91_13G039900 [Diphasiastrum complanatum]|nr:hypothetical protein O6H91_13G039800 [Diphasiastrum complanatum]KAJ7533263.1 hypothetical protein O6H91_13G039900 [Diphasiastrum complanatum]